MAVQARVVFKIAAYFSAAALYPASMAVAQTERQAQPVLRVPIQLQRAPAPALARTSPVVVRENVESLDVTVKSLNVKRQISMSSIRTQPKIMLGSAQLDFQPMLQNPRAPFNVANSLRSMPQLVDVRTDETSILEIDQGVVVHSVLTYQMKFGACNNARSRAQLETSGIQCGERSASKAVPTAITILRKLAPVLRLPNSNAGRTASVNPTTDAMREDFAPDIAELRAALNDPAKRAQIETEIGSSEAARIENLTDDQLAHELADFGETTVDQLFFIPKLDALDGQRLSKDAMEHKADHQGGSGFMLSPAVLALVLNAKSDQPPPSADVTRNLQTKIFLTGFTLGRKHEWSQSVTKTIKWCLVGCKKTYYVKADAGFTYGFGLRFPIKLSGQYQFKTVNGQKTATLRTDFSPINGSAADYASAGLSTDQLFDGKELVAEFGGHAGGGFKLPVYGEHYLGAEAEIDFTDYLDAPFTDGQFAPPAPGSAGLPSLNQAFTNVDLIAGRANFGVVAAEVFPAVKVDLVSDALRFELFDMVNGQPTALTASGQVTDLAINGSNASNFSIGAPVYNLAFNVTPGVKARLSVNLGVWSDHWDWDVWFPQMAVKLPPGGADFACHADTECTRIYNISPSGQSEMAGASSPFEAEMQQWGAGFDNQWIPQCADGICEFGIKLVRLNTVLLGKQGYEADNAFDMAKMESDIAKAGAVAAKLVEQSKNRVITKNASNGWAIIYQSVWSKRCKDVPCIDNIAVIVSDMTAASINAQQANPDEGSLQIQGQVGMQFKPRYEAEIAASEARAKAALQPRVRLRPMIRVPIG